MGRRLGARAAASTTDLFLGLQIGAMGLDAIATLDNIRLQRNGTGSAVQLEEEAAGVAQN